MASINIHKNSKYLKTLEVDQKLAHAIGHPEQVERHVEELAKHLRSRGILGRVLRSLIWRIRHPNNPYQPEDLRNLLLLSRAEVRAQEKK